MAAPEPKAQKVQVEKQTQNTAPSCDDDPAEPSLNDLLDSDDFAKQLAANMEQLMGQMGGADIGKSDDMNKAFEKVWASFDSNTAAATASAPAAAPSTREVPKVPQSFQDTIGQTMNKLKDSSKEIDVSKSDLSSFELLS